MGGFSNAFVDLAKAGVEKLGAAVGHSALGKDVAEDVEKGLYHAVASPKTAFNKTPVGAKLWEAYSGPFHQLTDKYLGEAVNVAEGKIKPAANSPHANITFNQNHSELVNHAKKLAMSEVFGPKRGIIQGALKHIEQTAGKNHADTLADHLNVLFQEAPDKEGLSRFDRDMRNVPSNILKGAKGDDREALKDAISFQTPPSKYRAPNRGEKIAGGLTRTLAYKAAVPHLASHLNVMISDGFETYAKALATTFGPGRKAAEAQLLATNQVSELVYNGYRERQMFQQGLVHKVAPGSIGEFIHRNMFIPGMSFVRYNTVLMSTIASKLAAEEAAQHLMSGELKKALPIFNEMHIDPMKIKAQGGQFLPEDLDKIYHHGTDFRAFLNQGDRRTILGQQSPMFRVMGAFHKYVANQAGFFRDVFKRQYQQGDFVGIARNVGLMSMAFPVMGAMIYESERLLTGNDWDDPGGHLEKRIRSTPAGYMYDKLAGVQNTVSAAHVAYSMLENLSHMGAFGVATGYVRAASRDKLAEQILGPTYAIPAQLAQDGLKAADGKPKPLERDLLTYPPTLGAGGILAKQLIPSAKKSKKYHAYRRTKHKQDSENPFSNTFDKEN